jgi:hypothetical protein
MPDGRPDLQDLIQYPPVTLRGGPNDNMQAVYGAPLRCNCAPLGTVKDHIR